MKNILKTFLLCALILPNMLVAQSKKIKPAHLIGTWVLDKIGQDTRLKATFTFNKDNSFEQAVEGNKRKGTWEIDINLRTLKLTTDQNSDIIPIESLTNKEAQLRDTDGSKNLIVLKKVNEKQLAEYLKNTPNFYIEPKEEAIKEAYEAVREEIKEEEAEPEEKNEKITLPANFPILGTWVTEDSHKTQIFLVFLAEGLFVQGINDRYRKGTWTLGQDAKAIHFQYDDGQPASFEVMRINPKEMQSKEILTQTISVWKKQ